MQTRGERAAGFCGWVCDCVGQWCEIDMAMSLLNPHEPGASS